MENDRNCEDSWNLLEFQDRFNFAHTAQNGEIIIKRVVLSELAQLFDPLGFLSPVLILGKIFMQKLWLLKQVTRFSGKSIGIS